MARSLTFTICIFLSLAVLLCDTVDGRSPIYARVPPDLIRHEHLRVPKSSSTYTENLTARTLNSRSSKPLESDTQRNNEPRVKFSPDQTHRILHQGINLHVSKLLDELDSIVRNLHKTIHGSSFRESSHNKRNLVNTSPNNRVSTIVANLHKIFPNALLKRTERSSDTYNPVELTMNFTNTFRDGNVLNNTRRDRDEDFEYLGSLRYWYNVGSKWLQSWRESISHMNDRILHSNFSDEYVDVLNSYLKHINVHIETQKELDEVLEEQEKFENTTKTWNTTRKKRYLTYDSLDASPKNNYMYESEDYSYMDPSSLKEKLRESLDRLNKVPSLDRPLLEERDGGHGGYGGHNSPSYHHLDPYLVLAALAACVFFGVIALSLYCMSNPTACCAPADDGAGGTGTALRRSGLMPSASKNFSAVGNQFQRPQDFAHF